MVDLTVIIVTYNSQEQLPACATALDQALAGLGARVVVVDSASADDTAAVARSLWPGARVIERPVPVTSSKSPQKRIATSEPWASHSFCTNSRRTSAAP